MTSAKMLRIAFVFAFLVPACVSRKGQLLDAAGGAGRDAGGGGAYAQADGSYASSEVDRGPTAGADGAVDASVSLGGSASDAGGRFDVGPGIAASGGASGSAGTGGSDAPISLLPVGATCSGNSDCALGHCVDGFCCSTSCSGCYACANNLTGASDGTCAPVLSGKNAHATCADETATNQCGNDGTCDGKGACRKVSASHVCKAASCSADGKTFTPATTCDGAGACTVATPQSCGSFDCATTGCLKVCTSQADCGAGNYCNTTTGTCAASKPNGSSATIKDECTSGIVADGVCCDKECPGCAACTAELNGQVSTTTGQCLPVVANKTAPHGACTASSPCGQDGTCNGNGGCSYPAAGTSCATPSCAGSTLTTSTCDSAHTCITARNPCPNATVCSSATTCTTGSCSSDANCAAEYYCASGTCMKKTDSGGNCSADHQCVSGNCVAGICCGGPCGECNSCSTGTCLPVADLTTCGTVAGKVCVAGACVACAQGTTCTPSNSCQTGTISCTTGSATCVANGNRDPGYNCAPGKVCYAGTCQAGCWIGGFVASGSSPGSPSCQICNPSKTTTDWSNNDGATVSCVCGGTAPCVNQQAGTCSKSMSTFYRDSDGDNVGNPAITTSLCAAESGWVSQTGDCDDTNPSIKPGWATCNYVDGSRKVCDPNYSGSFITTACAGGCRNTQCRTWPPTTNTNPNLVTCGTTQCPTSQGCYFPTDDSVPPQCGAGSNNYAVKCDGQNDCPSGQVCCAHGDIGGGNYIACMSPSDCPLAGAQSSNALVCDPNNSICPSGSTCNPATNVYSVYTCSL